MQTPEENMIEAIFYLKESKKRMQAAANLYSQRNDTAKADAENCKNVTAAVSHLSRAYDEISEIQENDLM